MPPISEQRRGQIIEGAQAAAARQALGTTPAIHRFAVVVVGGDGRTLRSIHYPDSAPVEAILRGLEEVRPGTSEDVRNARGQWLNESFSGAWDARAREIILRHLNSAIAELWSAMQSSEEGV